MGICGEVHTKIRKQKGNKNNKYITSNTNNLPSYENLGAPEQYSNYNSKETFSNSESNYSSGKPYKFKKNFNEIEEEKKRKKIEENNRKYNYEMEQNKRIQKEEEEKYREKQIILDKQRKEQLIEEEINRKNQDELDKKKRIQKEEEKKYRERQIELDKIKKKQEEEEKLIRKNLINPELMSSFDIKEINNIKIIEEKKFQEKNESQKFYDMILDFNSFEQLKKDGWIASFSQEGKEKYEKYKNENNITIGIIGNKNRGKSYLLGRIIGKDNYKNPNGFLVTTQGISANFPVLEENDNVFITLDTAGKDNPLLENAIFTDNCNDKEYIKRIARDQKVTEIVLADFIIQESNILITVLEQLSFAEQDMLKNLLNQLRQKKISGINNRKLIVIHNLMNITSVDGVKTFIRDILKKSLTFSLIEQKMSDFKDKKKNIDDTNKLIYIQKTNNIDKLEIIHLVIGNDTIEEIKKEYNEPAFRYIRKAIRIASHRKFDLIDSFINFIITNSQKYINGEGFNKDSLKKDCSQYNDDNNNDKKIKIQLVDKNNPKIDLKGVIVDSKGIHNFLSSIEPRYSTKIIERDNQLFIEIEFEMFGKLNKDIKSKISIDNNQYLITINGNVEEIESSEETLKQDNKSKNTNGNLKYSEFYFQVIIDKYIPFKNKEEKVEEKKEYNITEILNQQNPEIISDETYGIYKLIYPVKFVIIDNSDEDDSKSEV